MKPILISDPSQYNALREIDGASDLKVLCDNPRFEEFLNAKGVPFDRVSEFDIQDSWDEINEWGCSKACELIRTGKESGIFKDVDIASVIYHHFSRTLIHLLKNSALADFIVRKYHPGQLYLFDQTCNVFYPDFSGNFFLRYFLAKKACEENIPVQAVACAFQEIGNVYLEDRLPRLFKIRNFIISRLKRMLGRFLLPGIKACAPRGFFVCGALNHLSSLIIELKKRSENVVLYSTHYQRPWHNFAKTNSISYVLASHFPEIDVVDPDGWVAARKSELRDCLSRMDSNGALDFHGRSFFSAIEALVLDRMDGYLHRLAAQYNHLQQVFSLSKPKACLAHDDFSLTNGFVAAVAKKKGIPVFCLSHANLALDFKVPVNKRSFCQSVTFVNSQFEKDMYGARGWSSGENMVVRGIPRYDRLFEMKQRRAPRERAGSPLKLLFCATGLWKHSPNQRGYLGCEVKIYEQTQLPAFLCAMNALKGLQVELIIKPHSHIATPMWKNLVAKVSWPDLNVIVAPHDTDIFKLYMESDAMLLSYWSTALIETAMIRLPTIFIDAQPPYSSGIYDFARDGFCKIARNEGELRQAVLELVAGRSLCPQEPTREKREYYLGAEYPGSTSRVADDIIQRLRLSTTSQVWS